MVTTPHMIGEKTIPTFDKTAGRFYAPELDALRFLAFILVFSRHVSNRLGSLKNSLDTHHSPISSGLSVGNHSSFLSGIRLEEIAQCLDFGVCLFFFLSSFLITRLLLIEREATGHVEVGHFYLRRCLRIWPLYFFFLFLVLVLSRFFPVLHMTSGRLLAAIFFVSNWAAVFKGWASFAIQPLWSVSVEEQFYLVWPIFACRGRPAIVVGSSAMVILSLGTLIYFGNRSGSQVTATWPNTLVQGLFLAGGALTASFSFPETRWLDNRVRCFFLALGGFCWLVASTVCHVVRTQSPGPVALLSGYSLVLVGTILIFNGVAGWSGSSIPKILIYLGKVSFGLYVFHVASLLLVQQAMASLLARSSINVKHPYLVEGMSAFWALALTIICASLTYRFLERPFLELKDRFAAVRSRVV